MALKRLAGTCYDKDTCPTIFEESADTAIVQGYPVAARGLPSDERAVEIPAGLLREAVEAWLRQHPASQSMLAGGAASSVEQTMSGTLIVEGRPVPTSKLAVPPGERAVAVPVQVLIDAAEELAEHAA